METPQILDRKTYEQSEQIKEFAVAFCEAQKKYTKVEKSGDNVHFRKSYATKSDILNAVRPGLLENGLSVSQTPSLVGPEVLIITTIQHISGQFIRGYTYMRAIDAKPQGFGSVASYAERYALRGMLGIPTEDCEEQYDGEYPDEKPKKKNKKPLDTKLQNAISQIVKAGRSLGQSEDVLVGVIKKPLALWDGEDVTKAKAFLKGLKNV